jgi:hypothetical protein
VDHPDGTAVPIVIQLVVGHLVVVHLVVWLLCAFSCFCFCHHLEIFLSREKGTYLFWSYLLNLEWSVEADFLINIS